MPLIHLSSRHHSRLPASKEIVSLESACRCKNTKAAYRYENSCNFLLMSDATLPSRYSVNRLLKFCPSHATPLSGTANHDFFLWTVWYNVDRVSYGGRVRLFMGRYPTLVIVGAPTKCLLEWSLFLSEHATASQKQQRNTANPVPTNETSVEWGIL